MVTVVIVSPVVRLNLVVKMLQLQNYILHLKRFIRKSMKRGDTHLFTICNLHNMQSAEEKLSTKIIVSKA